VKAAIVQEIERGAIGQDSGDGESHHCLGDCDSFIVQEIVRAAVVQEIMTAAIVQKIV
jgi:hypothetical protein